MVACGRDQSSPKLPDSSDGDQSPLLHRAEDVESLSIPVELREITSPWTGDLDGMAERRLVRAAVTRSGFFYYIRNGREYGVTSEFLRVFEKDLNKRLGLSGTRRIQVIAIPMTRDRLLDAVTEGRADIAAAGLTITADRLRQVDFSEPWTSDVREVLVTSSIAKPIVFMGDLAGREIVVRVSSSYYQSLRELSDHFVRDGLAPIDIVPAHEIFEDEDLLEMTSVGMIGITVADDYIARFWQQTFPDLTLHEDLAIREDGRIAWAFRKNSPLLAAATGDFVTANRPGTRTGNVILKRYLDDPARVTNALAGDRLKTLTSGEPYFRKYGKQFGFDWLMLAAQGYQESRLDNSKVSRAGAIGIMQVLPTTADSMGVSDYRKLDGNIRAGAMYMRHLVDIYLNDDDMDAMNQWLLALASYNAGATRIRKLRRQAATRGLNPNRWFDNVELTVAETIGSETVVYVRNVMKYYLAYRLTFEKEQLRQDVLARLAASR
jgi:membrane-bound lytic murein transglycosylase MltF